MTGAEKTGDKHFDHITITLEQAIEVCREAALEWWRKEDISPTGAASALIARLVERFGRNDATQ